MKSSCFCSAVALLFAVTVAKAQQRPVLFEKSPSQGLTQVVNSLRDLKTPKSELEKLTWSTPYFVRVAARADVLTETNALKDSAIPPQWDASLGTRPFVFITSPESLYGRSLLEIYQDIGYEAEGILRYQLKQHAVAIVFRYADDITPATQITDGRLPVDWKQHIYVPHWDNVFSLFHLLTQEATIEPDKSGAPFRLFFQSEDEKKFARKTSKGVKRRLKSLPYLTLKVRGGGDWRYRSLLENKLALYEHFRGSGHTQNEVWDPDGTQDGLVEFVGPNRRLKDLAEVAIIDLGSLTVNDPFQSASAP